MPAKKSSSQGRQSRHTRLSMAAENYLLSIFRLEEQGQHVTMTRLGDHLKTLPIDEGLGTSLPSVAAMIRRMGREGLVSSDSKKGVTLTRDGLKAAESIVRRHRLSERMVVDLLGMELERCHIEAHRLEHAISPELEEKIAARLGDVKTCPFGHPVPGTGYSPPEDAIRLADASAGRDYVVDRVPEDDQALLEYLVAHSVIPGQVVAIEEAAPARGVMTMVCNDSRVAFSYDVAATIWVCPQTSSE